MRMIVSFTFGQKLRGLLPTKECRTLGNNTYVLAPIGFSVEAVFKSASGDRGGLCGCAQREARMDNMARKALGDLILVIFGVLIVLAVAALF